MGWILLILVLFVIALLIKIVGDLKKLHDAGAHDGPPAATNDGIAALQGGLTILQTLGNEERKPTAAECKQLKELYEEAQAGNVSTLSLEPLRNVISKLCPDS